jgi:hypothetical protein
LTPLPTMPTLPPPHKLVAMGSPLTPLPTMPTLPPPHKAIA